MSKIKTVTMDETAARLGVARRTLQRMMMRGDKLEHISDYRKVDPSKPNSTYIITPKPSFFKTK